MTTETQIEDSIEDASSAVGAVWPLHSFVTANPLSGFEDRPFHEAVGEADRLFGADGYPDPATFRAAWEAGHVDPDALREELAAHGYEADPETLLERMEREAAEETADAADGESTPTDEVDRLVTKWLAAFLDQGRAEWPMPNREDGFYAAFRSVARHDGELPDAGSLADLPDEPLAAIESLLSGYPADRLPDVFEYHLTALPGWTGYLKQRADDGGDWQAEYPVTLTGYLAARIAVADLLDAPMDPHEDPAVDPDEGPLAGDDDVPPAAVWLSAWEASYRDELVAAVSEASADRAEAAADGGRPDAQLVFCIDTRSEVFRRHLEATGAYETHGYAGFFGIPMRYEGHEADVTVDACPPVLEAEHHVAERPTKGEDAVHDAHDRWTGARHAGHSVLKSLKSNAATAFSFVESAGAGYGAALAARTLVPARVRDALETADGTPETHEFCEPRVDYNPDSVKALREGLTHEEQVEYAAQAFELMGWEEFARVVAFVGHASETSNNPYDSSLDCGACAGNPGGPSARVLAAICNDEAVREGLAERGIEVPADTVFVAGEHNTTTDEVTLYDGAVPESHAEDLATLRADLETARAGAAAERTSTDDGADAVRETERRAADWAETRPEWGLAGNAGFVVGPRDLTADLDLDGRAFLHSYDHSTDPDGDALEAILTGPMVVTQWINCQYYFATVDNAVFGSGSKVTQNPVGNVGVYQGNGGDLQTGLPLQSLVAAADDPVHQPLRLSTVVHAPVERVTEVLAAHEAVAGLLDNGWLSLTVVDPEQDHAAFEYDGELTWTPVTAAPEPAAPEATTPAVADD